MIHSLKVIMGVIGGALLFASTAFAGDINSIISLPEPATLTLLGIGGAALYLVQRRNRKK